MNSEKPIRDQAERLRKRVEKTGSHDDKRDSLPPRSEIHRQKQKKTNVKIKYPVIRLMALFFVLLPVIFFSIISYLEGAQGPLDSIERAGIELIDVQGGNKEKDAVDKEKDEEEDVEVPAIEDVAETDVDINPAPASPSSGGDKDSPAAPAVSLPAEEEAKDPPQTDPKPENQEEIIYHTVQPKETIYRVSMKYYGTSQGIERIKKANNLQGIDIQAGQVLKILK